MTQWMDSPVEAAANLGLIALGIAQCLCFVRLVIGPSLPDRIICVDLIATLLIGMLVLSGIPDKEAESLRVATVLALTNFLATVMFGVYVCKREAK
jgi:multicomponent Na+:H+ antiporter subunit F